MTPAPPLRAQAVLQSGSATETAEQFIERKRLQWEKDRARASIRTKDIGRRGFNTWTREAWTFLRQESYIVAFLSDYTVFVEATITLFRYGKTVVPADLVEFDADIKRTVVSKSLQLEAAIADYRTAMRRSAVVCISATRLTHDR